ncbi:hypothetical protein A7981_07275 [Methylovorus sp. MM2]|uniref:autotransporter outer membrane beta-barrel domain-containing protein n=1 Tax=Methylovorus sp. MM2 TaxID=1848038 RepID=UPI0007E1DA0A|nr:autotransporter domain-containing protein [Methylovorus sp. MM2]OAM53195.1 hypothetical protein A7981_07275 [Methylovorus sp. MM2]
MRFTLKPTLVFLPLMLFAAPIYAADYDASVSGAITSGDSYFFGSDTLSANITGAVIGGTQTFFDTSSLKASVSNAVSGGTQAFYHTSTLNASIANAISGGIQVFEGSSSLNASASNAISDGIQVFWSFSSLNASVSDVISGGTQAFEDSSSFNASAANAISGGTQTFEEGSSLNASAANAVSGGDQTFRDTSSLNATVSNALSGGTQNFLDSSNLNASASNAVSGGTQEFNDTSSLNASASNAINGGVQRFYNTSSFNASASNAISGGDQRFNDTSSLNASAANAVSGGGQLFYNTSSLNASVANAISGGIQNFNNSSSLNASVADAISGGSPTFFDSSSLNASAANAISGGILEFFDNSTLNVSAANAISGGIQRFYNDAVLVVSGAGRISSNTVAVELLGFFTSFDLNGTDAILGSLSVAGTVKNASGSSTLTIDTSVLGDSLYYGSLDANGGGALSLVKAGTGTWNFNGTTNGTLNTVDVEGGTLAVGVGGLLRVATNIVVDSGARFIVNGTVDSGQPIIDGLLGGNGTLTALDVLIRSGGTLAPGNSIGTLTVNGDLTFAAGSNYNVEVNDAGASDRINVNGNVIINGGTVNTIITPGNYIAGSTISYDILNYTGTLTGAFAGTTTDLAFFSSTLDYSTPGTISLDLTRNNTNFTDIGGSYNQMQAASGLTPLASSVIGAAVLGLDAAGARNAFSQLAGEVHASAQGALIDDTDFVRSAVTNRLYQPDGNSVWFKGSSIYAYGDRNSNTDSTSRYMNGGIVGTDRIIGDSEAWTVGLLGGYGDTRFNTRSSRADIDSVHLGGYAGRSFDKVSLKLGTSYGYHRLDTGRNLAFGSFNGRESADYNAHTLQAFADLGYRLNISTATIEPFVNVAQVMTNREGFTERGDAAALKLGREQTNTTLTTAGVRFTHLLPSIKSLPVSLNGSLGLRHAEGDVTPKSEAKLNSGTDFDVRGNPIARDAFLYDIGLNSNITPALNAGISYRGQHGDNNRSHAANVYVSWVF